MDVGGQDATEAFEDVGHSDEAREVLEGLLIGTLKRQVSYRSSYHHLAGDGQRSRFVVLPGPIRARIYSAYVFAV